MHACTLCLSTCCRAAPAQLAHLLGTGMAFTPAQLAVGRPGRAKGTGGLAAGPAIAWIRLPVPARKRAWLTGWALACAALLCHMFHAEEQTVPASKRRNRLYPQASKQASRQARTQASKQAVRAGRRCNVEAYKKGADTWQQRVAAADAVRREPARFRPLCPPAHILPPLLWCLVLPECAWFCLSVPGLPERARPERAEQRCA